MQNKLLNLVAGLDWISPVWAIARDFLDGPAVRFGVLADAGFDRGDIRRLLSTNGVESWGYIYNVGGDLIMFSVPVLQAAFAFQVLEEGGVVILFAPDVALEPQGELAL